MPTTARMKAYGLGARIHKSEKERKDYLVRLHINHVFAGFNEPQVITAPDGIPISDTEYADVRLGDWYDGTN